ncbi:hypothetical protein FQA39_LY19100 [Lamprigera yunnana]|nr:hypothetical protein FQA39_LY19100 [Lamprigera yunnana]
MLQICLILLKITPRFTPSCTSKTEIEQEALLLGQAWKKAPPICGIFKSRCIQRCSHNSIALYTNTGNKTATSTVSFADSEKVQPVQPDNMLLNVGNLCVVSYDGIRYPGEITDVSTSVGIKVSVMVKSRTNKLLLDRDVEANVMLMASGIYSRLLPVTQITLTDIFNIEEVAKELDEVFGKTNRPITKDDLSKLIYMEKVVKETMRIYPPVPVIARSITEDVDLDGIILPSGVSAAICIIGIHRDPETWPDPLKFDPTRNQICDDVNESASIYHPEVVQSAYEHKTGGHKTERGDRFKNDRWVPTYLLQNDNEKA